MGALGKVGKRDRQESITGAEIPEIPSTVEAAQAARAMHESGPKMDDTGADGILPEHQFDLDFIDNRGRRWAGRFACHVLTVRERIQVGLVRSRLSGGISPHALDVFTSNLVEILAHLAVALDNAPPWAKGGQLEQIRAVEVLQAIYEEVAKHETRFHGPGAGRTGEGSDPESAVESPMDVAP
jgi:hypothetical protein